MRVPTPRRLEYDRLRSGKRKAWFRSWRPRGSGRRLSDHQVRWIRRLVLEEGETMAEVARRFEVSYCHGSDLVHGRKRAPRLVIREERAA